MAAKIEMRFDLRYIDSQNLCPKVVRRIVIPM